MWGTAADTFIGWSSGVTSGRTSGRTARYSGIFNGKVNGLLMMTGASYVIYNVRSVNLTVAKPRVFRNWPLVR